MRTLSRFALSISCFCWMISLASSSAVAGAESRTSKQISLQGTWRMQSSCVDKAAPEAISTAGFADSSWHKAEVPGTVVGALVADGTLPDPNYGMNLKSYPGMNFTAPPVRQRGHARRQPLPLFPLVPHGVHIARGVRGRRRISSFSRHQLPRQHLAQWQKNCRPRRCCRRLSLLRIPHRRTLEEGG